MIPGVQAQNLVLLSMKPKTNQILYDKNGSLDVLGAKKSVTIQPSGFEAKKPLSTRKRKAAFVVNARGLLTIHLIEVFVNRQFGGVFE
jgi:hypothetical protein